MPLPELADEGIFVVAGELKEAGDFVVGQQGSGEIQKLLVLRLERGGPIPNLFRGEFAETLHGPSRSRCRRFAVAALYVVISAVHHSIRDRYLATRDLLRSFEEKLDHVERDLKRVREIAEDSELPEHERSHRARARAFEGSRELPLPFLRNLPAGATLRLIRRSRSDSSGSAAIDEFDYRHEHVEEGESNKYGKRVHGFSRHSTSEDWSPFAFFANDSQASASDGSDQLRRRLSRGPA